VPTALLAGGERRPMQDGLPGIGRPLQAGMGAFVPSPSVRSQEVAALRAQPDTSAASPSHLYEVGLTAAAMGSYTAAIEALRDCTARAPDHAAAWRKLAELLRLANQDAQADAAMERASSAAGTWESSSNELVPARLEKAEQKLRQRIQGKPPQDATVALSFHLFANPRDAAAMRLLAQLHGHAGDVLTALRLLERALDLCPSYIAAREDYAEWLLVGRTAAAAEQTTRLLAHAPRNAHYRYLHARALIATANLDGAVDVLAGLLNENPRHVPYWLSYAQTLHYLGRRQESMLAFRRCLDLQPGMGEAYWGLAELKGNVFTEADIATMRTHLERDALQPQDRMHLLYALASALERTGDFSASFAAYSEGARLFRAATAQSGENINRYGSADDTRRMKTVFSRENLETRLTPASAPATRDTPIFVVGMPRAGSTLLEQILASHSQVEGTRELPVIGNIVRDLALSRCIVVPDVYPDCILDLTQSQLAALGARYLEDAGIYRKTKRPYFVDKRPWNWLQAGLIHLILPHAKIIDIRREPMAACFAMFKQVLHRISTFSYDLRDAGLYYNNYVGMMEHWQSVLPGRIHFVRYERLVEDPENEIRRILDYCGLPFEESCLRFWESGRTVLSPSAEQVRRPIYRDALQQWRNFEPWLGPLKEALNQPAEI
jgi:predicted Zn-dependent protease